MELPDARRRLEPWRLKMAQTRLGWACWVLAAFLPVLVACSGTSGGSSSADIAASPARTIAPAPPREQPPGGAAPLLIQDLSAAASELAAHLAARLGVDPSTVTVLSVEPATWPNGCLGLETANQVCSQALVEGWLAILRVPGGQEYRYRGTDSYFLPE